MSCALLEDAYARLAVTVAAHTVNTSDPARALSLALADSSWNVVRHKVLASGSPWQALFSALPTQFPISGKFPSLFDFSMPAPVLSHGPLGEFFDLQLVFCVHAHCRTCDTWRPTLVDCTRCRPQLACDALFCSSCHGALWPWRESTVPAHLLSFRLRTGAHFSGSGSTPVSPDN